MEEREKTTCLVLAPDIIESYLLGEGKDLENTIKLIEDTEGVLKVTSAYAFVAILKKLPFIDSERLKTFLKNVRISQIREDKKGIIWEV